MQTPVGLFLALCTSSCIVYGAQTMRPGLWEHTTAVKSQSGEMEKAMKEMEAQMAAMPPEQRRMMEGMMASHELSSTPQGTKIKTCITPEQAKMDYAPQSGGSQCTQKIVRKSGNTVWFQYTCKANPPTSGEGEYTLMGDKAYKGKMTTRTTVQGRTDVIQVNTSGIWLSDHCGAIKPRP